ncbi:MAG: helix-turn-helix domain-containing protein [Clostridiaceae bacterium]|nr:helix-turn-helix domain-containing protein [Clostridiaceae bacterium]
MNSGIRVIIIDDDSGIVDSIKGFLEDKYYIEGFTSSRDGLSRLQEEKFDLLILDYYIDELNASNIIDEIRKYNNDLYILLLTGFSEKVPGRQSLETLKIQNYYEKTGDFEKLIIFIEGIIKSIEFFKSEKPTIGERIKELRKQHGLSQEEVSRYLEIQRSTISLYESGDATPPTMTIIKLARLFNVTTDYILCYELNVEKNKLPLK